MAHLSQQAGAHAELANYAVTGAQLGVEEAKVSAGLFGTTVELIVEDAVTAENALATAGKLVAQRGISAVIGAVDDELTSLLSAFTQEHRVMFLNAAARGGERRNAKCHRYTFHVEPDLAMHVHALGQWLLQHERKRWYFVISGAPLGAEIRRRASQWLQSRGGVDLGRFAGSSGRQDYQPALEHLDRVQADAVFVALPGEDLQCFMAQYQTSGLTGWLGGAPVDIVTMWKIGSAQLSGVWATSWYH